MVTRIPTANLKGATGAPGGSDASFAAWLSDPTSATFAAAAARLDDKVVTSTTRPSSPSLGLRIYESNTTNSLIWNGSAWKYIAGRAIVTSSTRPTGGSLDEGLTIYETDTDRTLTYVNGAWVQQQANGELGYAQITTTPSASPDAVTDIPGLSVTVTVGTRPIWVEFAAELQHTTAGQNFVFLHLYEGSTAIQYALQDSALSGRGMTLSKGIRLTPTAGTHTYKLRTQASGGGVQVYAEANHPAYIAVREL